MMVSGAAASTSFDVVAELKAVVSAATTTLLSAASTPASEVPDETEDPAPEEEERVSAQALLILVSLLIAALLTSYYLQRWRIRSVHETVLSIFAGMGVGLVLRFSTGSYIKRMVTFDHTIFFNMLLPPIILNCGYNLQKTSVARNIPSVLTFAFVGTVVSAVVIGVLVQIYSFTGIESIGFSLLDSLILGTILSATDPVTILAVFEQLRVDPKLFSIIFGETVFNDAVAIVLFATLSALRSAGEDFSLAAVPHMMASFMFVFSASLLVGVATGVFMSLLCKHLRLYEYPSIEASLALLLPYQAYLFSNAIDLSGIVSLLFCAATMRQYAYKSLSVKSKRTTRYLFHLLSGLAENFVFIYLGISLFTSEDVLFRPVFIVYVMISTCISRYSAIFPLSHVLNAIFKYRHPSAPSSAQPVTHEEQTMLFWAGLRGAVAVALASEVSGQNGPLLRTTVLCVVVLSVAIFGGTTPQVVHLLGIRTGVPQPDSSDEEGFGTIANADSASSDESDGNAAIIDLSSRQDTPAKSAGQSPVRLPTADSHTVDVARALSGTAGSSSEDNTPLDDGSSPFGRFSSPWSETGMGWLARIKSSYRSLDRSLIYDLDKHYIQPLLIRQDAAGLSSNGHRPHHTNRRHRHRSRSNRSRESDADNDGGSMSGSRPSRMRGSSSRTYRAHSNRNAIDQQAVTDTWASYRPEEPNWGSDTSDNAPPNNSVYPKRPLLG